jgi:hypothetical protein
MAIQYLGLLDPPDSGYTTNHLLAIELDTVMQMELKDIDDNHEGIDNNILISVASSTAGYIL